MGIILLLVLAGSARAFDLGPFSLDGYAEGIVYNSHGERTIPYHFGKGHARYSAEIHTQLDIPIYKGWGLIAHVNPTGFFGHNIPQKLYTWRSDYIMTHLEYGFGIRYRAKKWDGNELGYINGKNYGQVRWSLLWEGLRMRVYF